MKTTSTVPGRPRFFYGWAIVAALFLTNFAVEATGVFSFGVFLRPMSEELNISRGAISWALTARRLASGLASLVVGRLLDRYGARVLITVAAAVVGIAVTAMGWVTSLWQFLLLFTIIGLSGISVPGNLLTSVPVAKWFVRKRGRATAFVTAGFGIGGMVFVSVHQALIQAVGWRTTWVLSGIFFTAVVVPVALLVIRRAPEDLGLRPDGDPAPGTDVRQTPGATVPRVPDERTWTVREAFRTSALWKVLAAYAMVALAMGGFQLHRIAFWQDRGYDPSLVAASFSMEALVFFMGIMAAGFLAERIPVRFVGAVGMASVVLGILGTITLNATWALFLTSLALGAGQGINMVVQVHIWPTYYGRTFVGSIRGYIVPTTLLGQALGAPFAGYVFDIAGTYLPAFWTSGALVLTAGLLLASARQPRPRQAVEAAGATV